MRIYKEKLYSENTDDWIRNDSDREAVKQGCYFDLNEAIRVENFFKDCLCFSDPPLTGKPITLLTWQWNELIAPLFGWRDSEGYRRFKELSMWIPKKNGKSTIAAMLMLYFLMGDREYSAECYSAAGDRKQAAIIYRNTTKIIRKSPHVNKVLKVRQSAYKITYNKLQSEYRVLAADAGLNEGLNAHFVAFDEVHTQKNKDLYSSLRYSGIAKRNSLIALLSTVGQRDDLSLWYELFSHARDIKDNKIIDVSTLPLVYSLAPNQDWHNKQTWFACNPSLGETIPVENIVSAYNKSKNNKSGERDFKRYILNSIEDKSSEWINISEWQELARPFQNETDRKKEHFIGIDVSDNVCFNAMADLYENGVDEKDRPMLHVDFKLWLPEQAGTRYDTHNRQLYLDFFDRGLVQEMPGESTDIDVVVDSIDNWTYNKRINSIAIDRYNCTQFSKTLAKRIGKHQANTKIRIVNYNAANMNEATKMLESLILQKRITYSANAAVDWMFSNIQIVTDTSGNKKIDKSSKLGKVDAFSALCNALYCLINYDPKYLRYLDKPTIEYV